jgi:hypothetical protein
MTMTSSTLNMLWISKTLELEWIVTTPTPFKQPPNILQPTHDIEDDNYTTMSYIFLEAKKALDNAITYLECSTLAPLPPSPTHHDNNTTWNLQPPDADVPVEWNNQWFIP